MTISEVQIGHEWLCIQPSLQPALDISVRPKTILERLDCLNEKERMRIGRQAAGSVMNPPKPLFHRLQIRNVNFVQPTLPVYQIQWYPTSELVALDRGF